MCARGGGRGWRADGRPAQDRGGPQLEGSTPEQGGLRDRPELDSREARCELGVHERQHFVVVLRGIERDDDLVDGRGGGLL